MVKPDIAKGTLSSFATVPVCDLVRTLSASTSRAIPSSTQNIDFDGLGNVTHSIEHARSSAQVTQIDHRPIRRPDH